jgi:NADPH:quinone reductase-like Zn-dependent oxidoreductase
MGPLMARWTGKQLKILSLKPNQGLDTMNDLFESGALNCVIDGPYDLTSASIAMGRFGRAEHIGKVVIGVSH